MPVHSNFCATHHGSHKFRRPHALFAYSHCLNYVITVVDGLNSESANDDVQRHECVVCTSTKSCASRCPYLEIGEVIIVSPCIFLNNTGLSYEKSLQ